MVLAWNEVQEASMNGILQHARNNGVNNATSVSLKQILEREPEFSSSMLAGVFIPGESLIDPWIFVASHTPWRVSGSTV
ncbi:MAG: L-2-hydroxyglutarate oxidase LhgO [Parasphingorhabdus sp.]|jgi:L-2-hydroxyglutarate oxidase LhgO